MITTTALQTHADAWLRLILTLLSGMSSKGLCARTSPTDGPSNAATSPA